MISIRTLSGYLSGILLILLLSGCAAPIQQSKKIDLLAFTAENSQAVALAPFYLVDKSSGADHAWYLTLKAAEKNPVAGLIKPNQLLVEALLATIVHQQLSTAIPPKKISGESVEDACRGSYQAGLDFAPDGTFSGALQFANYSDDCSLEISGQVPVSGNLDLQTGQLTAIFSSVALQAQSGESSYQVSGSLTLAFNAYQDFAQKYTATSELKMTGTSSESHQLAGMLFAWDHTGEYPRLSLTGRIIFSAYGAIDLKTDSPLIIQSESGLPFDGMLIFQGREKTWVRLFFPKAGYPGFFRLDGSDGLQTMGKL